MKNEANSTGRTLRLSLIVITTAQLMLVLDDAIANIALPSIQRDLGVPGSILPWIVNAYILAFGSLLLFGGRVGDLFGRRRVLRFGLGLFALASLLGGLGMNVPTLIAARGLQGLGAALVAPNALALIATTFPAGTARNSAMAIYGAMSALGITVGVLLGGVLTSLLSWRSVFFINIPIALAVLAGSRVLVEGARNSGRLDTPGAVTGTAGLFALAFSLTRAGESGWTDATTVYGFISAAILIAVFIVFQSRGKDPMLPLSLFSDRNRSGPYAAMLFSGAGLMGTFYLLTLVLQHVLHFSPLKAGLASLPFSAGLVLGSGMSSKLLERFSPRAVTVLGFLVGSAGMFLLSRLDVSSSYLVHVLPAALLTSFGLVMTAITMMLAAAQGVSEERAGVASALVNMSQQVGAALGLALFTTCSVIAADKRVPGATQSLRGASASSDVLSSVADALAHGYGAAFFAGGVMLLIAAGVVFLAVTTRRTSETAEVEGEPAAA